LRTGGSGTEQFSCAMTFSVKKDKIIRIIYEKGILTISILLQDKLIKKLGRFSIVFIFALLCSEVLFSEIFSETV
jgi:hypothetical protein